MQTLTASPLGLTLLLFAFALPACVGGPVAADTVSTSDSSGGAATSGTTTGGPGMCAWEPGDDQCDTCIKASCCDQKQACDASDDCACLLGCLKGGGPQICDQCTASPMQVPEFGALLECMGASCDGQCG